VEAKAGAEAGRSSWLLDQTNSGYSLGGVPHLPSLAEGLNALCSIVRHIADAPTVMIAQRNPLTRTVQVRGRIGTFVSEVDMSFVLPGLDPVRQPVIVVPDIRHDQRFQNHPMVTLMPHIKSMIALLIPGFELEHRAVFKIVNPSKAAISDPRILPLLMEIGILAGEYLKLERGSPQDVKNQVEAPAANESSISSTGAMVGFREEGTANGASDIAASFLLDTLVKKRVLHGRNNTDYVTLRTWRASLKKYQIAALKALKAEPPAQFVAAIADEVAANVIRVHGRGTIRSVVPIPPGSSGRSTSLSVLLAHAVADRLGANANHALLTTERAELGQSSPRKSGRLAPYLIAEPPPGPVLIVDDVASSGRHLELAIDAFRPRAITAYSIAWIGG
jgi:hypothetical protein